MTPIEFANVLRLTGTLREDSWDGDRYTKDWYTVAFEALTTCKQSTDFATPISVMLYHEYVDIWDWVEQTLVKVA